jgi:hypothetical protein
MEEQQLYTALGGYATENLFWSIFYLNSVAFRTPLRQELRKKLLEFYKLSESIMLSIYDTETTRELVAEVARNTQLYISYVDAFMQGSTQSEQVLHRWQDSGQKIAQLLCGMNSHWKFPEWSAMIRHEGDLLEALVQDFKRKNYTTLVKTVPVCRRLAVEMAQYTCDGILWQRQEKRN